MKQIVSHLVLRAIKSRPGRLLTVDDLVDAVYGEDPEGGSLAANRCIHEAIRKLRKQGHTILSMSGYTYPTRIR